MWLNKLKIAIIEKNTDNLNKLMNELPELESQKEINSAITLLAEATSLVKGLQDETKSSMIQMKKNIDFLNATQAPHANSLDIKS